MSKLTDMASRISKEITFDGGTVKNMAERISEQIKTPDEQIAANLKGQLLLMVEL